VWLALAVRSADAGIRAHAERLQLAGDRSAVREQTVRQALRRLREAAA
jgi:nicotinamide mononucleotide (NMN) deamidase PncC